MPDIPSPPPALPTSGTAVTYVAFPGTEGLAGSGTSGMSLAAAPNVATPVSGTFFTGPWLITEQSLEIDYIRKNTVPFGIMEPNATGGMNYPTSYISYSGIDPSGWMASELFVKMRPVVKRYISQGTYVLSSHEQLQEFSHIALNSDLGTNDYGSLATNRLGVRGKIKTTAPYLKREAYDSANPLHTATDYTYPDFYSYRVTTGLDEMFHVLCFMNASFFNHGAFSESWKAQLNSLSHVYDDLFSDPDLDFRIDPFDGGEQSWWRWTANPLLTRDASDNFVITHNGKFPSHFKQGNYDGSGEGQSPQDLINDVAEVMEGQAFKNDFYGKNLSYLENVILTSPNGNGSNYDYSYVMKSRTGNTMVDTSINTWLDALKTEYTKIRHI